MNSNATKVTCANGALSKIGVARITTLADTSKQAIIINSIYSDQLDYVISQHPWTFATKTILLTPMAVLWATGTSYQKGNYVVVGAVVYKCLVANVSSNFTVDLASAYWTANNWATLTAYVVGDFVNQGGVIYVCATPHTSGTFATDLASVYWIAQTNVTVSIPNFSDGVSLAYLLPTDWVEAYKWNFDSAIRRIESGIIYSDTAGLAVKYIWHNDTPSTYSASFIEAFETKMAAEACYDLTNNKDIGLKLLAEFDEKLNQAISKDSQGSTPDQAIANEWLIARLGGSNGPPNLPGQVSFYSAGV
jgi:hypothetical protein